MRIVLTTALDVLGLLAVAAGMGLAAAEVWLPLGPVAAGATLIAGVQLADYLADRAERRPVVGAAVRRRGGVRR